MEKINLSARFASFSEYWQPKIIAELNGQHVKIVKFSGPFEWHHHDKEDELFLVIKGSFDMRFRDRTVTLHQGELIVIPRGVDHCPQADQEVHVLLFEPVGTLNTGNIRSDKTVENPEILS